jgi:hypothetical protein
VSEFQFAPQQRVEPMVCPFCRSVFDGVTGITGDPLPENGSAMLCSECANFAVFDDTCPGYQREPTPQERAEMEADERLMFAQARMRESRGLPPKFPQTETLPCGCVLTTAILSGTPMFTYKPCHPQCQYFEYMMEEAARQGKPVMVMMEEPT